MQCIRFAFLQFHSLAPMYYRGSAAAVIVYDITKLVNSSAQFYTCTDGYLVVSLALQ